jgi:hypothetical protein
LRVLSKCKLTPFVFRLNVGAVVATLAAAGAMLVVRGAWSALSAFLIGHFAWSITLAVLVRRGTATR